MNDTNLDTTLETAQQNQSSTKQENDKVSPSIDIFNTVDDKDFQVFSLQIIYIARADSSYHSHRQQQHCGCPGLLVNKE